MRKDENGKVSRCRFCDNKYHYQNSCADYKVHKTEHENDEEAHLAEDLD